MTFRSSDEVAHAFFAAVNMPADEIERWLQTEQSQSVGQVREGEHESVGHQSGRRIAAILRKPAHGLDDADFAHMAKVTGYIHRHLAQRPDGDMLVWSGRTLDVPSCFIAGARDWGVWQVPGAYEAMQQQACTQMRSCTLIEGAGHWVQQERPEETARLLLAFLDGLERAPR